MRSISKLIIEKRETSTSREILQLFGASGILELLEKKNIENILAGYEHDKAKIKIIIFHASGRDGISPEDASQHLEKLLGWKDENTQLFAVSEGSIHRTEMEKKRTELKAKNSYIDSYEVFLEKLKKKLNYVKTRENSGYTEKTILLVGGEYEKERLSIYLLSIFLPLDIDMQALADKKVNKKEYLQEMSNNLEELYKLNNYNCKNIGCHYQQKLYGLWYLLRSGIRDKELLAEIEKHASSELKNLTPIDNPSKELLKIAGINNKDPKASQVYKFFESLDNARKTGDKDLTKTIKNLFNPFDIQITGEKKKITTFHDWYCALAKCLRNENKS